MEDEPMRDGPGDAEQGIRDDRDGTTSFPDSREAVISQKFEVFPDLFASSLSADEFAEYCDRIGRTADEIVKGGYKSV